MGRKQGISDQQLLDLPHFEDSPAFSDLEKLALLKVEDPKRRRRLAEQVARGDAVQRGERERLAESAQRSPVSPPALR